jgi:hypothetical protein
MKNVDTIAGLCARGCSQIKNQTAKIKNEEFYELMDSSVL